MFLPQIKFNFAPISRSPLGLLFLSLFFVFAPKIVWAQVVINEIMYAPAKGGLEWIELFNNGSSDVDLSSPDLRFNDGSNHLLSVSKNGGRGSLILPPGGYAILADDASLLLSYLPDYSGTIADTVMSLNNTSDTLKIINTKSGEELTSMSYSKTMGASGNGKTLEWDDAALKESLVDGGTPGRANSILTSSGATTSAAPSVSPAANNSITPTPAAPRGEFYGAAPNYQYSQKIFINEFLPWPEDEDKEWVELINLDTTTINLSGWQIDDADNSTSPQVIPAGTTINANGFLVISFNKNTLNNDGDKARLLWPDDQIVHSVTYDKSQQGQAVAKFDSGWLWTNQPTPGQANKKSFVEKNEFISSANASNNADRITAVEEAVASQTGAPPSSTVKNSQTISATPTIPVALKNNLPEEGGAPNPNLTAAAGEPIKNASAMNPAFALAGVIVLSALAAGGLISFRRQSSAVDDSSFDD